LGKDIALQRNVAASARVVSAPYKSQAAFRVLYTETHLAVFRFVYGLHGGSVQDAEDIAAETFTRAWKARNRFVGDSNAALGWLLKIARNLVIDNHRKHARRKTDTGIDQMVIVAPDTSPEEKAIIAEQCRIMWRLLEDLPDNKREMLVLRYMLGWRVNRIARHFGMPENTVSVTIRRLLKQLRDRWPQP
jgi:RNA polymerase sigma-70 factor (ECF subfamily)